VATANSPAAVYYNPAGLTQLEDPTIQGGLYTVRLGLDAYASGKRLKSDATWKTLPQLYGAVPLAKGLVAGFGLNTPFGLSTDWPNTGPIRTFGTKTDLKYLAGWAVLGYKLADSFSIGGGVGIHRADLTMRQGIGILPNDQFDFTGNGTGYSWLISARWQPHEQHSFGLIYRSQTDFDLKGRTITFPYIPKGEPAAMDFMTPATAAFGYAFRPNESWEFELNVEYVVWDKLDSLAMVKRSGNLSIPFFWDSNFIYSAGVTRRFGGCWIVNAGYNYIENSQPDATFTPAIADADRHWINLGIGQDRGRFSWFLAYQYAFSGRQVNGSPVNAFGQTANGKYNSRFHSLSLNGTWHF
jgi:long-chain fatty acid transport protein